MMQFGELLSRYRAATTVGEATRAFSDALEDFGFTRFTYLGFPNSSSDASPSRIISTYPAYWRQRYFDASYDRIDPVVRHATQVEEPFSWGRSCGQVQPTTAHERQMFDEAADCEIRSGLTVPIRDRLGRLCTVSVSGNSDDAFDGLDDERWQIIHLGSFYLHATFSRLDLQSGGRTAGRLSERERAVLLWASRGKTADETGEILGMTGRTAHFHLANCKKKLSAATVAEAVAIGLSRQLIPPSPF